MRRLRFTASDGQQYTLYQSSIVHDRGVPVSTFTVANDPGLKIKYAGAIILCTGIFLMFYMNWWSSALNAGRPGPRQNRSLK